MGLGKRLRRLGRSVAKGVRRAPEELRNAATSVRRTAVPIAALPFTITADVATESLAAVRPAIGEATGIIRDNPELVSAGVGALSGGGLGALASLGGGAIRSFDGAGSGFVEAPSTGRVPVWAWIVGGVVVLFVALRLMRK